VFYCKNNNAVEIFLYIKMGKLERIPFYYFLVDSSQELGKEVSDYSHHPLNTPGNPVCKSSWNPPSELVRLP
jgi:hypothetical protein